MDLKLWDRTGQYYTVDKSSEGMERSIVSSTPATGVEVIAGKVVKFLLTTYGSDALAPEYGSRAFAYTQIAESYLPKLRLEIEEDVARCEAFILAAEKSKPNTSEKLSSIVLRDVVYDAVNLPDRIDVYIEITTNYGNSAVMSVPVTTKT